MSCLSCLDLLNLNLTSFATVFEIMYPDMGGKDFTFFIVARHAKVDTEIGEELPSIRDEFFNRTCCAWGQGVFPLVLNP